MVVVVYAPTPHRAHSDRRASKNSFRVDSPMGRASKDVSPSLPIRNHVPQEHLIRNIRDHDLHVDPNRNVNAPNGRVLEVEVATSRQVNTAAEESSESESTSSSIISETENNLNNELMLQPRKALIRQKDQVVYQAAWYHSLLPDSRQTSYWTGWRNQCKMDWNRSFWQMAQHDDTLLEMFLSFAAAKESAVKGAKTSRGYYLHKGRALTLIRRDITRKRAC